ncbi:endonuclease-reverse transcriptase [Elysia marginata]|uniref:Endonuclease-reverse transcriptase n=1 Tax=Elysia marginata TaxID=1093978 RepID=A0AAV4HQ07_9GAST|nr:endonuclease-reverse transcriptase [Elysia marginata]
MKLEKDLLNFVWKITFLLPTPCSKTTEGVYIHGHTQTAQDRWRSSIMGVRTLPGADCGTDRELLMAEVKTRLKLLKPGARPIRYDLTELPLNIAYKLEIKNRFDVLGRITEQMEPNDLATEINKIFKETTEKHIPKMKTKKMPWISNKTLHNIEQRREAKKTFRKQSEQYKDWNKEVKNAIKNDKKEYLESHLSHIEI